MQTIESAADVPVTPDHTVIRVALNPDTGQPWTRGELRLAERQAVQARIQGMREELELAREVAEPEENISADIQTIGDLPFSDDPDAFSPSQLKSWWWEVTDQNHPRSPVRASFDIATELADDIDRGVTARVLLDIGYCEATLGRVALHLDAPV